MKLKNKVVIVTGASRGLGKAMALGLAREGAALVAAARTETGGSGPEGTIYETAEEIKALGARCLALKCDVTQEEQVAAMVSAATREFGSIDALINNAGIAYPAPIWEMPLKRWELVLRVNLTGAFLCTKAVLPVMMKNRKGSIINISSVQAQGAGSVKTGAIYGVSKAALERFTTGLAAELGRFGIAVNCLKPRGSVESEGMRFLHRDVDQSRWDTPDMMVRAAVFLAGLDSPCVNGMIATDEEWCSRHGL